MKFITTTLRACCAGAALLCSALVTDARDSRAVDFNRDWRFSLTDASTDASSPAFDDSGWRRLNLPHDWAIEGDFNENNPSGTGGGALPGGIGWYRKTFATPAGEKVYLDFDGAYMNASVFVNGRLLGTRPYGYASFSYDITDCLNTDGRDNIVAVKVDNAEQPNSRWYSGCGIYRNVWLRALPSLTHIAKDGVHAITDIRGDGSATVDIKCEIVNPRPGINPRSRLLDSAGKVVATGSTHLSVERPQLWSVDTPVLYTLEVSMQDVSGEIVDTYTLPIGFRYFKFDPDKGFSLNGKPMKINGVCLHHDAGALGAAVNTRAIRRQLEILREMGVNAIRCSHNPPAPELLDLCDEMGFLVMDETFDMWRKKKTAHDYARYFNEWHERDLTDQVKRDRNHPSVIMWSIGNEVLEQWSHAEADTLSLEEANLILNFGHSKEMLASENGEMSVNSLLTVKLADMVRALDPGKPVTAGCNEPDPGNHLFRSGALDLIGFNYHDGWFAGVPQTFPGKPFIVTESVSGLMTRGYYRMPSDSTFICPDRWDKPYFDPTFACSSYDNCHVPWGNSHEGTMRHVLDNDFIAGQFVWTGFDYIGEPTPYGWPARSSYFGIVDLAGFPKDIYYMYQSQWRPDKEVLHVFPHWNWTTGETVDVWAYYNNADEVELFVNGRSQGRKSAGRDFHVWWRVVFEPGEITAVSYRDGREVARRTRRTARQAKAIVLTPDRREITADGYDLSYITVEAVDADNTLCPLADNEVTFSVDGAGFNAGVDNGSPISLERFKADKRHLFNGKALLIVQNDGTAGPIRIKATAPGLRSCEITLNAK